MRLFLSTLALTLFAVISPAAAQSIDLKGPDGHTVTLSAETVAAMPQVKVTLDVHGVSHVYEGPLLIDVLKTVGAPTGRDLHGAALASAIIATAADGYQVVFGLAEADPGTRPNRIILADKADGAALDEHAGAFQIVVEGDLRPARSIRQVVTLEVRSLATMVPVETAH